MGVLEVSGRWLRPAAIVLMAFSGMVASGCRGAADEEAAPRATVDDQLDLEATVMDVSRAASVILVQDAETRMWSVSLGSRPSILLDRPAGGTVGDLIPGLPVRIYGRRLGTDSIRPDSIRVVETPDVVLSRPRHGVALTRPVISIEGHSRRGRDPSFRLFHGEEVLAEGRLRSEAVGARMYGRFRHEIALPRYELTEPLTLEIRADGGSEEPLRRAVRFADLRQLTLYYPSLAADPERLRCDGVYPITQTARVLLPPDSVVAMLMREVPREQARRGVFSELGAFGGVRSVAVDGGSAHVDLGPASTDLDRCARDAARAQLTATLRSAFGVDEVVVTVAGRPL